MNVLKNRDRRISKYKLAKGCVKCGYRNNSACLHFDHRVRSDKSPITKSGYKNNQHNPNSSGGFYRLYKKKYPLKMLMEEIRKCDLVCANCHGEKTYPKRQVPVYM
jgi:hypothetical protein